MQDEIIRELQPIIGEQVQEQPDPEIINPGLLQRLVQVARAPENTGASAGLQQRQAIEALWQEGEARSVAGDTSSGIQHLLNTRRQMPGAWRLLTAWG